jgi:thiamine pyrophosphokinase
MNCVYENKKNILIFTGGKSPSTEKILSTLKNFKIDINISFVICADSGLEIAQNCGIKVDFLLGDMDSIDKTLLEKIDNSVCKEVFSKDKDFSDTELAFVHAKKIPHNKIFLIGGSGGRVDHFIALLSLFRCKKEYNSIMDFPDFWLTEENLVVFCKKNSKFQISGLEQSDNVSVFSLFENNFFKPKIFSSGLKWKLQNVNWKNQWSLSNRISENSSFVEINVKRGNFLLILPLKDNININ